MMIIIQVTRTSDMPETEKLEFIREIGFTHMRISGKERRGEGRGGDEELRGGEGMEGRRGELKERGRREWRGEEEGRREGRRRGEENKETREDQHHHFFPLLSPEI